MSNILQIAYTTEGTTDERFLGNIIEKTFESILLSDGDSEIEIHSPVFVKSNIGPFNEKIKDIATTYDYFHVICVHCDSDDHSSAGVINNKINPAFQLVQQTESACKNLVPIIPIQMTEAWMLADINLLLEEIGAIKTCTELNLPCKARLIEAIANPKVRIEEALRLAQMDISRRHRKLKISDLYTPISQKLSIEELEKIPSFSAFKEKVKRSLIYLNYIHE